MRYRDYAPVNEGALTTRYSEFIMFFAYWWFFHNLFYDPAHLYGDGMPDPRDFTGMLTDTQMFTKYFLINSESRKGI